MKDFFKSKLNIALTLILVVVLSLAVYLAINITGFSFSKRVQAIDFTGYSKTQVETWLSENKVKESIYSYSYEYSDDIEKDYVVYQSVKAGDDIKDALVFIYSNGKDPSGEVDLPSLTAGTTEEEIESWLNLNEFTNVNYVYETSDTHEFGTVISISPSKAKKSDVVTVSISLGSDINEIETEVPDFSNYSKEQIIRWGNRYAVTLKIDYEAHDKAKNDEFLSQSVAAGTAIKGGDSLIVTLSSGQSDGTEATIPADLLGISESEFKTKLKELGFNNLSKSNTTYYAESLDKDTIYSYDDGIFSTSRTINYALCTGKYVFNADDFNGLTKTKAQAKADDYKNRNARVNKTLISISFVSGDINADKANEVYDCAIDGSKISCKVYSNGESATIPEDGRYLGVSESDFLTQLQALGFTSYNKSTTSYYSTRLAKDTIYSYDDGEIALAKSINYALSAGAYSFNASDFNGVTQNAAQSKADDLKKRNARLNGSLISIKFTSGDNSGTKGNTYDCVASGSTISCKVYGGTSSNTNGTSSTKATIPGNLLGKTESEFVSYIKNLGFTKVTNSGKTYYSTTLASGTIYTYPDGIYSIDEEIVYGLSQGKYTFNASDYNGKSQSAVQSLVSDQASRNAKVSGNKISVSFTNGTSGGTAGNTYDCVLNGSVISCKLYTSGSNNNSTMNKVNVSNYTGQAYTNLQSWASSKGLSTSASYQYSDSVESGVIISQSPSSGSVDAGSTITAVVSQGKETATIMNSEKIINYIENGSTSYATSEANAKSYFSDFTNVTITGQKAEGMTPGTVISLKVNGSDDFSAGSYSKASTTIEVVICTETAH